MSWIRDTIQIEHAISRIQTFYRSERYKPNGFYISDLISSEYGVGLILDNHINRPGYLSACLKEAMNQAVLLDPANWGTAEERKLLDTYLKIRSTYGKSPMTDADKRAAVTGKYLENGTVSAERGSFRYHFIPP